ncbi:dihydroflavonol-4-reductase [Aaosphaeria arxii CBS 175.79]|uniref:Dihydroflavonol-4-reductase n=1 Tax=Aaosphaeria arxii CBS 175.79 TaxID=1450172 RepID=A0A6A5XTF7_9PLEO|nr:dihydroflavonol-4-reductase [Aaosphaeria arxii CBS 175.79]KAF2016199.1 dihydroflavonol-4-reductase [Aaosphaeria arxii CBS 175.79]
MPELALQPGSWVFVTGVNGLIGSHIADQLLARGYNVRGAVRDVEKCNWLKEYFDDKYSQQDAAKFELVAVPDMAVEGCYDDVVKGTHGFIHVASPLHGPDARVLVPLTVQGALNAAKAAAKTPTVTRFVFTSSSIAATIPKPNVKFSIDASSFNDAAVEKAFNYPADEPQELKGMYNYAALKTAAERAMWKFVNEEKPGFVFNSVLPNANYGKVLIPTQQGTPSTIAWAHAAFTGELWDLHRSRIPPQYFIDTVDTALLHVSALIHASVSNERLFGFAEPFHWDKILGIFRRIYPERTFPADDPADDRRDLMTVPNKRAEEVLGWVKGGGEGWTGLEVSLREMSEAWV